MNCLAFRCKINILAQYKLILFLAMAEGVIPVLIVYLSKTMIQALLDFQSYPILLLLAGLISLSYFVEKICVIYRSIKIKDRLTRTKNGFLKNIISTYCKTNLIFAESEEAIKAKEAAINAIEFNDSIKNYLDAVCKLISGVISMAGAIYIVFTLNFFLIFIVILVFIPEFWINSKKKKIDYANMKKWGELNRKTNCYSSLLTEIKTIKELKVFQAGSLVQDSIEENDKKRTAEMLKQEKKHSCLDMMFFLCKTIGDGVIYCYLAVKLWAGEIQISQFALFIGGINTMSNSINNLSEAYVGLKQYNAFLSDYTGFYSFN